MAGKWEDLSEHVSSAALEWQWHSEDVQGRRQTSKRWRREDVGQVNLENARALWLRFVEKNRRDVEEKSEQLKAVSNIAALFAGFAVVTLTQFQLTHDETPVVSPSGATAQFHLAPPPPPPPHHPPIGLVAIYGVLTAIVEGLMITALVTCGLILGSILKVGRTYVDNQAELEYLQACRTFWRSFKPGDRPPQPRRTFEHFWDLRCEDSWQMAFFCFRWGVSMFLLSLVPVGYITFIHHKLTSISFTITIGLGLALWAFVQFSWGSYLKKRPTLDHHTQPWGGSANLPYDWHLAPEYIPLGTD